MRLLAILVLLVLASPLAAQPTTYTLQTPLYGTYGTFGSPCAIAPCADFPIPSQITGSFTTSAPLAPNLSEVGVQGSITSFSFFDGLVTYDNTLADVRLNVFTVSTNASGAITGSNIEILRWLTGVVPHTTSDRLSVIVLPVGEPTRAYRNLACLTVGVGPSGAADSCLASMIDISSSFAASDTTSFLGPPPPPSFANAVPVPASSGLALALLAMGIAAVAWRGGRSRQGATRD